MERVAAVTAGKNFLSINLRTTNVLDVDPCRQIETYFL